MSQLVFAVCTYNRSERLRELLPVMRKQTCPIPFEILVIDNNSSDNTREIVDTISKTPGIPIRYVFEGQQGITYARNRAIDEALEKAYLVFIDDDEIPAPGLLEAAYDSLDAESADCVGGVVKIVFSRDGRPRWLGDELLGFLAELNYGPKPFWITDRSTPIWTSNIAYNVNVFRENQDLRFDGRFNRRGNEVGGGEDAVMFWSLLERGKRIRYRQDMVVEHYVEEWRLKRRYFIKLHFVAGRKYGEHQMKEYSRDLFGVPPFMILQALKQWWNAGLMYVKGNPGAFRQAMNGAHASGSILGCFLRWRDQ